MKTLTLQAVHSILFLAFGLTAYAAALRIARRGGGSDAWWHVAGITFAVQGVNGLLQDVLATRAYFAGQGAPAYEAYMWFAPLANHSRTFVMFTFCVSLSYFVLRRLPPLRDRSLFALILLGMAAGAAYGFMEGSFDRRTHYTAVALLNVLELVSLLGLLYALLVRETSDRLLWGALATYAFGIALNIFWMIGLTNIGVAWSPAPWHMAAYRVVLAGIMVAFAVRRLRLAGRGERVRGFDRQVNPLVTLG
jgi:hypothetical protein